MREPVGYIDLEEMELRIIAARQGVEDDTTPFLANERFLIEGKTPQVMMSFPLTMDDYQGFPKWDNVIVLEESLPKYGGNRKERRKAAALARRSKG